MLESHPNVAEVHYPGLESHPGHELAAAQMSEFGAMLSFRVRDGREAALEDRGSFAPVHPGNISGWHREPDRTQGDE